jgi:hypothetical protein
MKQIVTSKATGKNYLVDDSDVDTKKILDTLKSSSDFSVRPYQKDKDTESIWELYVKHVQSANG